MYCAQFYMWHKTLKFSLKLPLGDSFYEHCLVSIEKDPLLHVKVEDVSDMEAEVEESMAGGLEEEEVNMEVMLEQDGMLEKNILDLSDGNHDISYRCFYLVIDIFPFKFRIKKNNWIKLKLNCNY